MEYSRRFFPGLINSCRNTGPWSQLRGAWSTEGVIAAPPRISLNPAQDMQQYSRNNESNNNFIACGPVGGLTETTRYSNALRPAGVMCCTRTTKRRLQARFQVNGISLLVAMSSIIHSTFIADAVITWNNGPEDEYFCGFTFDDPLDCSLRQNCRTGEDEECEGSRYGEKCFASSGCDSKFGGGRLFVSGIWDRPGNGMTFVPSDSPVSADEVLEGAFVGLFEPTRSPVPPGSPTLIPTGEKVKGYPQNGMHLDHVYLTLVSKNIPSEDLQILLERARIRLIITFVVLE